MVGKCYFRAIMVKFGSLRLGTPVVVIIDGCAMLYRSKNGPSDE